MTPIAARDEMLSVFLAAWVASGQDPSRVVWTDRAEDVPSGEAAWARVTPRHANGQTVAFGDGQALNELSGTLWVQLFTPVGDANTAGYTIGHSVVTAYRAAKVSVWFRNTRLREVGTSGAFTQTNVLTDFSYNDR